MSVGAASAPAAEGKIKVFVYGTLRRGELRNRVLQSSEFLGDTKTAPIFTMLHLGAYPGVIKRGETPIIGELYSIDESTLRDLDRIEGHPTFYKREVVGLDNGESAWMYLLAPTYSATADMRSIIKNGDWVKRNENPVNPAA